MAMTKVSCGKRKDMEETLEKCWDNEQRETGGQ